eukprot:3721567-Prymnesium_polylepis.2
MHDRRMTRRFGASTDQHATHNSSRVRPHRTSHASKDLTKWRHQGPPASCTSHASKDLTKWRHQVPLSDAPDPDFRQVHRGARGSPRGSLSLSPVRSERTAVASYGFRELRSYELRPASPPALRAHITEPHTLHERDTHVAAPRGPSRPRSTVSIHNC